MSYVHVNGGTLDTISSISAGTVNVAGTPTVKPTGGTIAMLQAGTISSLPNVSGTVVLNGGTVGLVQAGTISMLQAGTISSLPAITGTVAVSAGTISSLPDIAGTVAVSSGTIGAATLAAGTAHAGQLGGHTQRFDAALTLSTAPYGAGDLLGTLLTCAAARVAGQGLVVLDVTVTDLGKQDKPLDVVFFDTAPAATTFTDNSALDVDDADLPKVCGYVNLGTADYCDFADNAVATKRNVGLAANPASGTLWYCAVTRGTPTYATADVTVRLGILQD